MRILNWKISVWDSNASPSLQAQNQLLDQNALDGKEFVQLKLCFQRYQDNPFTLLFPLHSSVRSFMKIFTYLVHRKNRENRTACTVWTTRIRWRCEWTTCRVVLAPNHSRMKINESNLTESTKRVLCKAASISYLAKKSTQKIEAVNIHSCWPFANIIMLLISN